MTNKLLIIAVLFFAAIGAALLLFGFPENNSVVAVAKPQPASPAWQYLGSQGDAPGQFQQPRGVTGLADGTFVVVDRAARVQHFSFDGKPLGAWSMRDHAFGNPKGLTQLPNGNLLVCDTHYGRVLEMTLAGDVVKQWGGPGTGPGEFTHPLSAVVDHKREVAYVAEYHSHNDRVQKFKLDGTFISAFGSFGSEPGQFQRPSGITLDPDGNVYVADACNHRIQKFSPEGKLLAMFGKLGFGPGELRYPYDIAYGPPPPMETPLNPPLNKKGREQRGCLYVAEFNNMRVSVWDTDGNFVRLIGGPGGGKEQFANPWSLTIDSRGRLIVSDTGNHRVQILDLSRKTNLMTAEKGTEVLNSQF